MINFYLLTIFEKETKDKKYKNNPYRAVNFKQELRSLCSIQKALLYMNRSIQAEGAYGIIK